MRQTDRRTLNLRRSDNYLEVIIAGEEVNIESNAARILRSPKPLIRLVKVTRWRKDVAFKTQSGRGLLVEVNRAPDQSYDPQITTGRFDLNALNLPGRLGRRIRRAFDAAKTAGALFEARP